MLQQRRLSDDEGKTALRGTFPCVHRVCVCGTRFFFFEEVMKRKKHGRHTAVRGGFLHAPAVTEGTFSFEPAFVQKDQGETNLPRDDDASPLAC